MINSIRTPYRHNTYTAEPIFSNDIVYIIYNINPIDFRNCFRSCSCSSRPWSRSSDIVDLGIRIMTAGTSSPRLHFSYLYNIILYMGHTYWLLLSLFNIGLLSLFHYSPATTIRWRTLHEKSREHIFRCRSSDRFSRIILLLLYAELYNIIYLYILSHQTHVPGRGLKLCWIVNTISSRSYRGVTW